MLVCSNVQSSRDAAVTIEAKFHDAILLLFRFDHIIYDYIMLFEFMYIYSYSIVLL